MSAFLQIVFGLLLLFIGIAMYMVVKVGSMSDEERESVGHGPK
jgi:flagellar biogenesis protein FliO